MLEQETMKDITRLSWPSFSLAAPFIFDFIFSTQNIKLEISKLSFDTFQNLQKIIYNTIQFISFRYNFYLVWVCVGFRWGDFGYILTPGSMWKLISIIQYNISCSCCPAFKSLESLQPDVSEHSDQIQFRFKTHYF